MEGGEQYNVPKRSIIDIISVSMQQQGFPQNRGGFFAPPPPQKNNLTILIPAKNIVFVLAGIRLVLEETIFLNGYHPLFPVFQTEVLDFYRAKNYI